MTDKEKIRQMLKAFDDFKQTMEVLKIEKRQIIQDLEKRLDQSKVEDVLKKLKSI